LRKEKAAAEAELRALRAGKAMHVAELQVLGDEKAGIEAESEVAKANGVNSNAELDALRKEKAKSEAKHETTQESKASVSVRAPRLRSREGSFRSIVADREGSVREKVVLFRANKVRPNAELEILRKDIRAVNDSSPRVRNLKLRGDGRADGFSSSTSLINHVQARAPRLIPSPRLQGPAGMTPRSVARAGCYSRNSLREGKALPGLMPDGDAVYAGA